MSIKDILHRFQVDDDLALKASQSEVREQGSRIEPLLIKINRCFVEQIFPGIFEMENDLNQMGFWNQINMGRSAAPGTGKPNIKDVTFCFYPERIDTVEGYGRVLDLAYRTSISATGDLRHIRFSVFFPKGSPTNLEHGERVVAVEKVDANEVDRFIESFILGALEIHRSDRSIK
jgi:hypothetical protein